MYNTKVQKILMFITILFLGVNAYDFKTNSNMTTLPYDRFIFIGFCLLSIIEFIINEKKAKYGLSGLFSIIRILLSLYISFDGFSKIKVLTDTYKDFGVRTLIVGVFILILQIITAIKTRKQKKMFQNDIMFM